MTAQDADPAARISAARDAAKRADELAHGADEKLAHSSSEHTQAIALTSIALSLSALATVLVATLDEESR